MKGWSIAYLVVASLTILLAFTFADTTLLGLLVFASLVLGYIIAILALSRKSPA